MRLYSPLLSSEDSPELASRDRHSSESTVLAAVGYLPVLFFLPVFLGRGDDFARFHGRQSMTMQLALFVFWIGVWVSDFLFGRVLGNMLILGFIFRAVALIIHYPLGLVVTGAYIVLAVIGIAHALQGRKWRIPVVSAYVDRLAL